MKKLIITGHVGKNPEVRQNKDGNGEFASFSVGVQVGTKQKPKTDWIQVTCNGKLVNIATSVCSIGTKVLIEGHPSSEYYTQENQIIIVEKVFAHHIEALSGFQKVNDENKTNSTEDVESNDEPF